MTFEIYKLEWILSRHTFWNTTLKLKLLCKTVDYYIDNFKRSFQ